MDIDVLPQSMVSKKPPPSDPLATPTPKSLFTTSALCFESVLEFLAYHRGRTV